jgi:tRNA 2-selenouridine synthase
MEWRELAAEDLDTLRNPLIIDVRSPSEFAAESIPEALNIPLLTDSERVTIGITYKCEGDLVARRQALAIIAPKIPQIIEEILSHKEHARAIVVHCWRGGLRSEAVSSVLSIAGIPSYRLTGGYKAWRNMVLKDIVEGRFDFAPIVLYGFTGAGKTALLQKLSRRHHQVLDLEAIANHRGSTFGGMGLGEQPSQKNFEAALWNQLKKLDTSKPVFIEAESRKLGKLSLPNQILKKIKESPAILVESSIQARASRIADEYLNACESSEIAVRGAMSMLSRLTEAIGKSRVEEISHALNNGLIEDAVKTLLAEYYDPLYSKSIRGRSFKLTISNDDPVTAVRELEEWTKSGKWKTELCET